MAGSITDLKMDVTKLKEQMEEKHRHDNKFEKAIDSLDMAIRDINVSVLKINSTLDSFKELPDKVRKLEDKSIFMQVFEKLAWIAVGALIVSMVNQKIIAPKEEKTYGIEYKVR